QAVWIIMGANIGTTITGQLISLDVGALAPVLAFLGVAAIVFFKKPKLHHLGLILAGFGILFIGMDTMSGAMEPLREYPPFVNLMTTFSNPLLGILVGAIFTAVIQSSSASVGILQALASSGLIPFSSAVYVLFGQNIGTCITAVLASVGTNRHAKRTTIIHLLFNLIGTTVFTILVLSIPQLVDLIAELTPNNPMAQIANMHTIFNVTTTLLLLPFGTLLAKLAEKILPDKPEESAFVSPLAALREEYTRGSTTLGFTAVHMELLQKEIRRMLTVARENVNRCFTAVVNRDSQSWPIAEETEAQLDMLNKEISQFVSQTLVHGGSGHNVADTERYFLISGNAERIGDHALNIGGYVSVMKEKDIVFSDKAKEEILQMQAIVDQAMGKVLSPQVDTQSWLAQLADLEQQIDDMTDTYRENHLARMREGSCSEEGCILFSELLTDFERIGDHILNIGQAYAKMEPVNTGA
ncbi:MAG: Na/Pi cotransporter family protein, partial [Clostridia bacterium]|nr:Na/Pi cotransporter family protein [Clostridia bacterium]